MLRHVEGPRSVLNPDTVLKLHEVEARLLEAVRRDRGPGPARDGFPSGRLGPGGEYAPSSTTEGAALAGYRLSGGPVELAAGHWEDPEVSYHHRLTVEAGAALDALDEAWRTLLRRLDAIGAASKEPPRTSGPGGYCLVCGRWVTGDSDDRLRRGMCRPDYVAWGRAGRPELVPQFDLTDPDNPKHRTAGDGAPMFTWAGRQRDDEAA
ncbi:MAG: hypothetical protein AB7L84_15095 [Acidimicrobiia bacterium]